MIRKRKPEIITKDYSTCNKYQYKGCAIQSKLGYRDSTIFSKFVVMANTVGGRPMILSNIMKQLKSDLVSVNCTEYSFVITKVGRLYVYIYDQESSFKFGNDIVKLDHKKMKKLIKDWSKRAADNLLSADTGDDIDYEDDD